MATKETVIYSKDNFKLTVHAGSLATGKKIWGGSVAMLVDTVVTPLVSGSALVALSTTIPGADANGDIAAYSGQQNVRMQFLAGVSKVFGVTVSFANAGFVDVIVQLATDNGGVVTSTANDVVAGIRAHALASSLLSVFAKGTGASLAAVAAATAIVKITVLGLAASTYDNAAGVAPLTIPMSFVWAYANCAAKVGDAPNINQIGGKLLLVDDIGTVAATLDGFSLTGTLIDIAEDGTSFVKIGGF